jgi:hypothetical protein
MAMNSKYGFVYKKHLTPGVETPATLEVILANSANLVIGDGVLLSSGYLAGAAIDKAILGILVGFVTKNGENIFKTKESLSGTKNGDVEYTAAADNTTVDQVKGVVVIDDMALFGAYSDSTITQAYVGLWYNGKVNDDTYIDGVTGTGASYSAGTQQFQLMEFPATTEEGSTNTTYGLFRIGRSQLLNDPTA